ncbi:carbohydrate kinase family protein [Priestia megaterium]|uniref:carbohydrate kinase family protein n=1 Tax=Priestia megaterium TaxID=1404 RepID=UPI003D03DE11
MNYSPSVNNNYIVCIGAANIDKKYYLNHEFSPGTSNDVNCQKQSMGGVSRNIAENLTRLNLSSVLLTCVGNDKGGQEIVEYTRNVGTNMDEIWIIPNQETGNYTAVLNKDGSMIFGLSNMEIYKNINKEMICNKWSLIKNSSAVVLDTNFSEECISYIINRCKLDQVPVYIDPVSVNKSYHLPNNLKGVNTIFPNEHEVEALTGIKINDISNCKEAASILIERGVENVIITLGNKGVYYQKISEEGFIKAIHTKIKDVTGAGDAFLSGYLKGVIDGFSIVECCKYGIASAHLTIQTENSVSVSLNEKNIKAVLEKKDINKEKIKTFNL